MADDDLRKLYDAWMASDWSENSREAVQAYYMGTDEDKSYLRTLLTPRIAFGTAGLRAEMLPGFANLNHVTVRQAVLGLAKYLVRQLGEEARVKGVVIGHDHRAITKPFSHPKFTPARPKPFFDNHLNSAKLAGLAASTLRAEGFGVKLLKECHTPLVSFAVRDQSAAAGVMITASHNPKFYNGLKVYWSSGCQINYPHDVGIASAIDECLDPPDFAEMQKIDLKRSHVDPLMTQAIRLRYETLLKNALHDTPPATIDRVVITPMHGVGALALEKILDHLAQKTSSDFVSWVESQRHPDPAFPTVSFPNPEEKGALDLAMQQADAQNINAVLAVDPDADRFAAAENVDGHWHRFTGNEMGLLLAMHILEERMKLHSLTIEERQRIALLTTTVSSGALSTIAAIEGLYCEETLTGFKWMSNKAQELAKEGMDVVFAYEEALGYMFPNIVYDKDGVAALLELISARQTWKAKQGLTPFKKLQDYYKRYGYFADANTYLVSASAESTNAAFAAIRDAQRRQGAGNKQKPAVVAGKICKSYRDLTTGVDTSREDGTPLLSVDPKTHMITCELEDARFTVRGSGTEPKVKLYVECRGSSMKDAQRQADELQKAVIDDWLPSLKS